MPGLPYLDGIESGRFQTRALSWLRCAPSRRLGHHRRPRVLLPPERRQHAGDRPGARAVVPCDAANDKKPSLPGCARAPALSCAIDRQQVLDTASLAKPGNRSGDTPYYRPADAESLYCYTQDLEKAKQLLAEPA